MTCQFFNGGMQLIDAITGNNIFAGTSVEIKSFSANLGSGGSESSLDLDLVKNLCTGSGTGNLNTGYAVRFICNGFVFGGIVDKIEYNESASGVGWKVKISDPRKFLDNVQLLLSGSFCGLRLPNFIDVQSILEGGVAGACGTSYSYNPENIMPGTASCNSFGVGRKGINTFSGKGVSGTNYLRAIQAVYNAGPPLQTIYGDNIYYNLSKIVNIANTIPYAGTDSSSMSLLQLITSICDEAGYDFTTSLNGNTINFQTINRRVQTSLNALPSLINTYKFGNQPTLVSSSLGTEVTYENTKKVIIGDNISYCKYGNFPVRMILGDFGVDTPNPVTFDQLRNGVNIPTATLSASLGQFGINFPSTYPITEGEILSLGSLDFWKAYSLRNPNSIGGRIGRAIWGSAWNDASNTIAIGLAAINSMASAKDALDDGLRRLGNSIAANAFASRAAFENVAYNWLLSFTRQNYGRNWMIQMPFTVCAAGWIPSLMVQGSNDSLALDSEIESSGGWTESNNVLGLVPRTADTTLFESGDGRLKSFIAFPTTTGRSFGPGMNFVADPGSVGSNYYIKNGFVYVPSTVDGTMYNLNGQLWIKVQTPRLLTTRVQLGSLNEGLFALTMLAGGGNEPQGGSLGDLSSYNKFRIGKPAFSFSFANIPFKSNVYRYGPYYSGSSNAQAFVGGGTEISERTDLNPWTYGNVAAMNNVGINLANEGLKNQVTTETGNITVAEAPGFSLGPLLNYAGLVLGSIVVNFGESGITSTYNFSTYSQKFGNYSKNMADNAKKSLAARRDVYDRIRDFRSKNLSELNNAKGAAFDAGMKALAALTSGGGGSGSGADDGGGQSPGVTAGQTSQSLLYASYLASPDALAFESASGSTGGGGDTANPRKALKCNAFKTGTNKNDEINNIDYEYSDRGTGNDYYMISEVGTDKKSSVQHMVDSNNYSYYAITSLDALLTPVSLYGSGGLSRLPNECFLEEQNFRTRSRPCMPPYLIESTQIQGGTMPINGYYLNPMLSTATLASWDQRAGGSSGGFTVNYIAYGNDPLTLFQGIDENKQQQTDFRFQALKGPLMLQSWGYDTEGKPIPNYVDAPSQARDGYFENTGLHDTFMSNWAANPKSWPVGPIDLRWDRERGVWVSPPSEKIVIAQLMEDLSANQSVKAVLLNPEGGGDTFYQDHDVYGPSGEHITGNVLGARILVVDFLGRSLPAGTVIYAYHYGDGKYLALETDVTDVTTTLPCTFTPTGTTTAATETSTETSTSTATEATATEATSTETPSTATEATSTATEATATYYTGPTTATYYTPTPEPTGNTYCYSPPGTIAIFSDSDYQNRVAIYDPDNDGGVKFCYEGSSIPYARYVDEGGLTVDGSFSSSSGPYFDLEQCECQCVRDESWDDCNPQPTPTPTPEPVCDVCDFAECFSVFGQAGVIGITADNCMTVYPLAECPEDSGE